MLVYNLMHACCPTDFTNDSHCLVLNKGISTPEFLSSLKGFLRSPQAWLDLCLVPVSRRQKEFLSRQFKLVLLVLSNA